MYLVAIDDLVLSDLGIGSDTQRPLITSESSRLRFAIRRREGVGGSVNFGGLTQPALWSVFIPCPTMAAHDAVLAAVTGEGGEPVRLLVERLDEEGTRVTAMAGILSIDESGDRDLLVDFESDSSEWLAEEVVTVVKAFTEPTDRLITQQGRRKPVGRTPVPLAFRIGGTDAGERPRAVHQMPAHLRCSARRGHEQGKGGAHQQRLVQEEAKER